MNTPLPNVVSRLSKEDRQRLLADSLAKSDTVRPHPRRPGLWLVSSHSHPHVEYVVRDGLSCGCVANHTYHRVCRHLVRVSYEVFQARRAAEQADCPACCGCGSRYFRGGDTEKCDACHGSGRVEQAYVS